MPLNLALLTPTIMKEYIVNIRLPEHLSPKFIELIPAQRKHVDHLFQEGTLFSYSLAFDRSMLWAGVRADSTEEVWKILGSFPLNKYCESEIYELAFHQTVRANMIELSLN